MDPKQPARRPKPRPKRRPGEDAKKLVRCAQALELRTTGATYREIGAALHVSEKTAYYDVQDELGRLDPVVKAKAERLRELEARRLDRYTHLLEPGILDGDPRAILAAVRLMERRAKLLGLDAPTTVTGPQGAPVNVRIVHEQLPAAPVGR